MKGMRSREYIRFALKFSRKEIALKNFFQTWLPDKIIDCHTHTGLVECIGSIEKDVYNRPFCSFLDFNLTDSSEIKEDFYPGKKIFRLRFANPFKGINFKGLNDCLIKHCPPKDKIALCGIPDDIEYTISMMANPRISALKMYYFSFNPPAKRIYHFFPKAVLEEAQAKGLPIILHLPGTLLQCLEQIRSLQRLHPKAYEMKSKAENESNPLKDFINAFKKLFTKKEK